MQGRAAEALAPLRQKVAQHCRRELLQVFTPQIDQPGSKRTEMLIVQAEGRITQSPLLPKVGCKPRSPICERLADRLTTNRTDESGNHNAQHLLNRNPCVTHHMRRPLRCPVWMTSLDPELQERLHVAREFLVRLCTMRLCKRAEVSQDRYTRGECLHAVSALA